MGILVLDILGDKLDIFLLPCGTCEHETLCRVPHGKFKFSNSTSDPEIPTIFIIFRNVWGNFPQVICCFWEDKLSVHLCMQNDDSQVEKCLK